MRALTFLHELKLQKSFCRLLERDEERLVLINQKFRGSRTGQERTMIGKVVARVTLDTAG